MIASSFADGVIPAGQSGSMSVSHQQKKDTLQTPLLGAPQYSHVSLFGAVQSHGINIACNCAFVFTWKCLMYTSCG